MEGMGGPGAVVRFNTDTCTPALANGDGLSALAVLDRIFQAKKSALAHLSTAWCS